MSTFTTPQIPIPETSPDDLRIGHLLGRNLDDQSPPNIVIIGFPSDEGVKRNGGRPGAAQGPDAIRHALYRMTPEVDDKGAFRETIAHTRDLGDLIISGNVEQDQDNLGAVLAPLIAQNVVPIILGGGHETAYGHFLGYVTARQEIAILNWDAHPDVRGWKPQQAHSGSPFRQALLHPSKICRRYHVAGLLPHSVSQSHVDFITKHKGRYHWKSSLSKEKIEEICQSFSWPIMASFDLDAVDQAFAPGVSAPAVNGLTAELWLHAAYCAGNNPAMRSMDLVELNPCYDRDQQTARLAALTVWYFLKGLSQRHRRQKPDEET